MQTKLRSQMWRKVIAVYVGDHEVQADADRHLIGKYSDYWLDQEFNRCLRLFADLKEIAKLQKGTPEADRMLAAMVREYTVDEIKNCGHAILEVDPNA